MLKQLFKTPYGIGLTITGIVMIGLFVYEVVTRS